MLQHLATARAAMPAKRLPASLPAHARSRVEQALEAHLAAQQAHDAAVQALLAFLDQADGDSDLEDSLGSQDGMWDSTNQETWAAGAPGDLEDGHDGREPDVDDEPSLAHTNDLNQARAQRHTINAHMDLEAEHDGREPDDDTGDEDRDVFSAHFAI